MDSAGLQGGYDYQFVDPGPTDDQKCPICHLVVRDAHQVTCCGKLFCDSCLTKHQKVFTKCPTCRAVIGGKSFKDTKSNREIGHLHVLCPYNNQGCDWVGELQHSDEHKEDCQFGEVGCQDCGKIIFKSKLDNHISESCPMRKCRCELCGKEGSYIHLTTDHKETCPNMAFECINAGCSVSVKRCDVASHQEVCPKKIVKCHFHDFGCNFESERMLYRSHLEKEVSTHSILVAQELLIQREAMANSSQEIQEHLNTQVIAPVTVKLTNFKQIQSQNGKWFSKPFYTDRGGYKMRLYVYPNGTAFGKSTHLSVFLHLMKGPNDDKLEFPAKAKLSVEMLNQVKDSRHYIGKDFMFHPASRNIDDSESAPNGFGYVLFAPLSSLDLKTKGTAVQYLKDDSLYFRIMVTSSQTKTWLAETM